MCRIWLDDRRPMPDGFDIHCFSADGVIQLLKCLPVTFISFDHDLGNEIFVGNGYDVAKYIEEEAYFGRLPKIGWKVHSANPRGERNITAAMKNAEKFWDGINNRHN